MKKSELIPLVNKCIKLADYEIYGRIIGYFDPVARASFKLGVIEGANELLDDGSDYFHTEDLDDMLDGNPNPSDYESGKTTLKQLI